MRTLVCIDTELWYDSVVQNRAQAEALGRSVFSFKCLSILSEKTKLYEASKRSSFEQQNV